MSAKLFRRGIALAAVLVLGAGAVRPAFAISLDCELQEHMHTQECYIRLQNGAQVLKCPLPVHVHRRECFPEAREETVAAVPETEPGVTTVPETEPDVTTVPETEPGMTTVPETEPGVAESGPCTAETETVPGETGGDGLVFGEDIFREVLAAQALSHTAEAREDDLPTVTGSGIRFRLFNYSLDINKAAGGTAWRPITSYFTFRNSAMTGGDVPSAEIHIPTRSINPDYDQDGFTANHATVENRLVNGMPVLSLTRNPDPAGADRVDPGLPESQRSLAYLFSGGDHAVTAFSPGNTILQRSGNRYFYNSRDHGVDYDAGANVFRLRSYAERNSTTAGYGTAYGDFIPFTYTGGETVGAVEETPYQVASADTDYWFGMTMDLRFLQAENGRTEDQDMIFRFSGDDDVWVFVDDVLVLDLGGTHGTATGSINFATGEIVQYLSWNGGTADSPGTSFPTTLRACFDGAGAVPNGGWSEDGRIFADHTEHTLKFFYLERGASVANCLLDFRLPTLPDRSLTVTKEVTGVEYRGRFPFTAVVTQNGAPVTLAQPEPGAAYQVSGNRISFSLGHGESITVPGIPGRASVTVTEEEFAGFSPWVRVEGVDEAPIPGNAVTVTFADRSETVHFINSGGYQLPNTGGPGHFPMACTGGGMSGAAVMLYFRNRRKKGGKDPRRTGL